jgi:hypothetical protein
LPQGKGLTQGEHQRSPQEANVPLLETDFVLEFLRVIRCVCEKVTHSGAQFISMWKLIHNFLLYVEKSSYLGYFWSQSYDFLIYSYNASVVVAYSVFQSGIKYFCFQKELGYPWRWRCNSRS